MSQKAPLSKGESGRAIGERYFESQPNERCRHYAMPAPPGPQVPLQVRGLTIDTGIKSRAGSRLEQEDGVSGPCRRRQFDFEIEVRGSRPVFAFRSHRASAALQKETIAG